MRHRNKYIFYESIYRTSVNGFFVSLCLFWTQKEGYGEKALRGLLGDPILSKETKSVRSP